MNSTMSRRNRAFSLIEIVIVVVIIGVIAAIAVPRMSRATEGASDSAVKADLAVLRNAIDLYAAEHGGSFPALADLPGALTQYTDDAGNVSATKDATHIYGPYLREVPPLKVGANKGDTSFTATAPGATAVAAGWYYDATTGTVLANAADAETDAKGNAYNSY